MSYQEYQYSWPSDSYGYSYSTAQQYTSTSNSQAQYATSDQFSTSASQDYQYETSYAKPTIDTGDYRSSYSTEVTSGSDSTMAPQYPEDQFSTYSTLNQEPAYQSQTYQYSNSQAMHDSPSSNEMAYVTETSYNTPYQYNEPAPTQMEVSASNHAYGGDVMDSSYGSGGNNISYDSEFSGSGQWDSGTTSSSNTYYSRNDASSSGMFLGDSTVDTASGYSGEMSSTTSGIYESTSNYFPHSYQSTNKTSYSSSSYQSRGQGSGSGYSRQGDRRQGGSNNFSRGGRMGRSAGSNRGGSFHSYGNTYNNKPTQSHADVSRDGYRGGGSQFASNRYTSTRSRGHSAPLSSPRSRGTSSFSRGLNGSRFNSNRGSSFQAKGPNNTVQRGSQRGGYFAKPQRYSNSSDQKATPPQNSASPRIGVRPSANVAQGPRKLPESSTVESKEKLKAPSRPQDKLLNEIEQKEKEEQLEKERKAAEEKEKAEMARKSAEEARKAEEAAQQKIMEEARKKAEEMARKLAPPSKAPETPEEIAKEEEIQRKIRESVVVVDPVKEMAMLTEDPLKDLDMPEELREILKTLTSDTFCKLCSLRMIGPHMAPMHYNGKNHLKKVRTFIQTNGRSAGFNMDSAAEGEESTSGEKKEGEAEKEEEMEVDEKKYCKICKVSFSHASQYEMHYKGKNHAKKVRSLANSSEIFECKLCCVTVTAQEHLTAHLNGARHKLQIRKSSSPDTIRGRGGFYRRGGRGGMGNSENGFWKGGESNAGKQEQSEFQGRGRFDRNRGRGRGGEKSMISEAEEELYNLLGLTPEKRFRFDIANYQTPSGSFYCSHCDLTVVEEPLFKLHLGTKKHLNKIYATDKVNKKGSKGNLTNLHKKDSVTIPADIDFIIGRTH